MSYGKIGTLILIPALAWLPVYAAGPAVQWRATVPLGEPGGHRYPQFSSAMQTANGDFLLLGGTRDEEIVLRLDPQGNRRWLARKAYPAQDAPVSFEASAFETRNGIVVFRELGHMDLATWTDEVNAIRYDEHGTAAARINLGDSEKFRFGRYGATTRGDVLVTTCEYPAMIAGRRSLRGGADWTASLGEGQEQDLVGFHERGIL